MKSKLILLLAIIMGLFTTFLFYQYMQRLERDTASDPGEWVQVIIAAQAIAENQPITSDMIAFMPLPKEAVTTNHAVNKSDVVGKISDAKIIMGESILLHRMVDLQDESLLVSRKIHEGYRAVSVGVNFVQTVSNLIEPEDRVDVIVTEVDQETNEIVSDIILQNVRVLAVGRRMIELEDSQEAYVEYSSVTLEVSVNDAVKAVNADERGNIQLVLHSRIQSVPEEGAQSGIENEARLSSPILVHSESKSDSSGGDLW